MKLQKQKVVIDNHELAIEIAIMSQTDAKAFKRLFDLWKRLNVGLSKYGRKVNIPEVLSEGMFCVFSGSVRFQRKIRGAGTVSFDTINLKSNRKEQIKATSIAKDLTSFGPKTEWDDLYFMNFYRNGDLDGSFDVYLIPNNLIYEKQVNKNQILRQQQTEKRRPRMSIQEIIQENKIKPLATNVRVWE
ncbi:MAG: Bsp6I family type II restriction endonuclease [Patescibacteria group bacterium]|nr:Bsp6I family type II restriction endonuclease [Patescibacteria group bacterium]